MIVEKYVNNSGCLGGYDKEGRHGGPVATGPPAITEDRCQFFWTLEVSSEQARRLHNHSILCYLDFEGDSYQKRRSIPRMQNLGIYISHKNMRYSQESNSNNAQKKFPVHDYADGTRGITYV